jgi:saccharopine dehydrogenase (NAD+, L-glutamate forming)
VQFTVEQLPEDVPITVDGFVTAAGRLSAGTYRSAVNAFSRHRAAGDACQERKAMEPRPAGRVVRPVPGRPHRDDQVDAWTVPLPTIDPQVVVRSARALDRYGPHFTYRHFAAARHLTSLLSAGAGVAGAFALAQLRPTREWLMARIDAMEQPDERRRARSWFRATFVGTGGGRRVVTQVSGGDPGYGETAKMLSESALCLAFDELPETAGQVTPAVAMGIPLRKRLTKAGIAFEVISREPGP